MWKFVSFFALLLGIFCYYWLNSGAKFHIPSELNPQYDYIIVGGGSAGAVLAARLSEDPQISVLLLEAGPADYSLPIVSHIPLLAPFLQQTSVDWQFVTVPQRNACLGLNQQKSIWPRGKVLGGSSVLNYMIHSRATPEDHNRWVKEFGCNGWGWEDVVEYYRKIEHTNIADFDPDIRGTGGSIECVNAPETKLGEIFLTAAQERGYVRNSDYNGRYQKGFGRAQLSIKDGWRQSTVSTYLSPAIGRFNLHVVPSAHVTKLNFDEDGRCVGVNYIYDDKRMRVLTNREVILSAGTVGSPQLLMVSGIGPKSHLEKYGIPVIKDLSNVGSNLQDHVFSTILIKLNASIGVDLKKTFSLTEGVKAAVQFLFQGKGLLSWSLVEIIGYMKSGYSESASPDIQAVMFPTDVYMGGYFSYLANLRNQVTKSTYSNVYDEATFTVGSALLRPRSKGEIRLESVDPLVAPRIDPGYLQSETDVKALAKGLKLLLTILKGTPFAKYKPDIAEGALDGCEMYQLWSDSYLECFVRHKTFTMYHPVGTCKMGSNPQLSVVDVKLRVHGVKGLRVVDASVFPAQISANTNIPVIMIAEKTADIIKNG